MFLLVEDDLAVATVLGALLAHQGYESEHVLSGEAALARVEARPFDLVISDVRMPGMSGLDLLAKLVRRFPEIPVILITAHGSVPMAVEAMQAGAADFMLKPFERDEIAFVVGKVLARSRSEERTAPRRVADEGEIIGSSAVLHDVRETIRKVASNIATVLIRGETGTGKELVARALHEGGSRRAQPFVRVNCGALPETLLESELFGHEKGAFTGASMRKPGRVELAHRGTLFLDEIGDVSLPVQVKLLRLLQERELERVGGTETIKVDVRFVTATHRNLEKMVEAGTFREDLFYRLNVVPIRVPPLRERGDDVERLANHFVRTFAKANGTEDLRLDHDAVAALRSHDWPGNVRELQNLMERLVVLSDTSTIRRVDVEREMTPQASATTALGSATSTLDAHRREAEKDALTGALIKAKNNRTLAARLLNVSRRTLYNKLREHGID